ncbi:outer membrane beta-barrel protein [Vibrio sp. OCN044]|uniref:Outer membrane beta-barrel protein n=1 Tax=Vibrio tetraodonis subsp. pristinus TaxID=2695891 RepID=A0A6L8LPL0_9VIBR|nr:outer membrane beta-barrel protein [Vibrio tetraodonis]MYM57815.1 outer membrane beta-barrel protein [Vibrio tetraodonis subsp. pristinus]
MKKTLVIAGVTAMVSMPSYANTYFALGIGAGEYDYSGPSSSSQTFKQINDMGSFGLKIGHYFNDSLRAYGYIRGSASDSYNNADIVTRELGAGADYLSYITSQLYLLAGGNLGYQKTILEDTNPPATKDDNTGLSSGINLGLGYNFTENFALEVGYRYSYYFSNDIKNSDIGLNVSVDSNYNAYLNAKFKF